MQTIAQALQQAVTHHQAGELREAEQGYRGILQLDPRHSKANHNLGALYVQKQQPEAALPLLAVALEADPAHGQYWLSYIDALHLLGRVDEARQVLALARQGGLQGADVDALAKSLEDGPLAAEQGNDDQQAQEQTEVLIALFNQGRYEEAEKLAQRMTERFPWHWAGWKMLGVLFNRKGLGSAALFPMQQAVALLPEDAESHNNLGIVLQSLGRLGEAEASYRRALQINPGYVHAHGNLGSTYQALGRLDEAEASYRRALQLAPDYVKAQGNLGSVLQDMGRLEEAVACYLRVLEIEPRQVDALYNLGVALHLLGRRDEAEAALQYLLRIEPGHAEANYRLGNVLFGAGRAGEAEAYYRNALKANPAHVEANNNLAVLLTQAERKEDLREAEECCRKALRSKPDFAEAHNNLGLVLHASGRLEEAEASYRRALQLAPDFAAALGNLGATLHSLGRLKEAAECCRKALQYKPDLAEAHINLGYVLLDLDDAAQAAIEFQRAMELSPGDIGLDAAVYLAVLNYLDGKHEHCRKLLDQVRSVMEQAGERHRHVRGYWVYLDKLLAAPGRAGRTEGQEPAMQMLHAVGESHVLSAHDMTVRYGEQEMLCVAEWMLGCKQWHLGNAAQNRYKQKFDAVMARLPRGSTVLLAIGEIDCRHDEGILKMREKHPEQELAAIVQATVEAYIAHVAALGERYGHRLIQQGVPAPNVAWGKLTPAAAGQLVALIRLFNASLKERSLMAGMDFLDVYALTDRGDGSADGQWHIDQHHLLPGAMAEAFNKYCLGKAPHKH